jgi:hypothetical protein
MREEVFTTERLVVRPWVAADAERNLDIYSRLGLDHIIAVVLLGNEPSVAVTRRLGMEPIGRSRRWYDLEMDGFRLRRA